VIDVSAMTTNNKPHRI